MHVKNGSPGFFDFFRLSPNETLNKPVATLGGVAWLPRILQEQIDQKLQNGQGALHCEVEHDFPKIGKKHLSIYARRVPLEGNSNRFFC